MAFDDLLGDDQTEADSLVPATLAGVALPEGLDKLRPGMTADVWLDTVGESP